MLLPVGDTPNPRTAQPACLALIAVNVLVFALVTLPLQSGPPSLADRDLMAYIEMVCRETGAAPEEVARRMTAYDLFVYRYGFRATHPGVLAAFLSMFLHAGLLHLASNLLFLGIFGDNVEERLGSMRFVGAYLITGAAALLVQGALIVSPLPAIGASGAIAGVMGLYWVLCPANQVNVLVWLGLYVNVFRVPARFLLGLLMVIDNLLPLLVHPGGGPIAHGAHLGGFVAGLVLGWAWVHDRPVD